MAVALFVAQATQPASEPADPSVPMLHCSVDSLPCWHRQALYLYDGWETRGEIVEIKNRRLLLEATKTAAVQRAFDNVVADKSRAAAMPYPDTANHWAIPLLVGILIGVPLGAFATFEIVTHLRR